jgi:hypothetical protein
VLARGTSRHEQVGDVGSRDAEDEERGDGEDPQRPGELLP